VDASSGTPLNSYPRTNPVGRPCADRRSRCGIAWRPPASVAQGRRPAAARVGRLELRPPLAGLPARGPHRVLTCTSSGPAVTACARGFPLAADRACTQRVPLNPCPVRSRPHRARWSFATRANKRAPGRLRREALLGGSPPRWQVVEGGRAAEVHQLGDALDGKFGVERTICDMARVTYESRDDAGHRFWVAHYGRYVIRIDANRPGVYGGSSPWRAARSARVWPPTVTRPTPRCGPPWTSCPARRKRA
jgi:hypothetical protein